MESEEIAEQIREAIGAPGSWTLKLSQAVLTGQLTMSAGDIARDDRCGFGQWLHHLASAPVSAHPCYKGVLAAHAAFHQKAGAVARKIEAGEVDAAKSMLESAEFQASIRAWTTEMARWRANI